MNFRSILESYGPFFPILALIIIFLTKEKKPALDNVKQMEEITEPL